MMVRDLIFFFLFVYPRIRTSEKLTKSIVPKVSAGSCKGFLFFFKKKNLFLFAVYRRNYDKSIAESGWNLLLNNNDPLKELGTKYTRLRQSSIFQVLIKVCEQTE